MKFPKLREKLARLAGNPAELAAAMPTTMQATIRAELAARTVGGTAITPEQRDEILRAAVAGEYVELEVDILAYEQQPGARNRNSVRFRDGAMMSLGRSGAGTPFLRDHKQWDVMAAGGTILTSATDKRADGDYVIRQTAKLTAPWAVDLVLRELVHGVSIGWRPTGPILCSVCDVPIFTECWHCPGDDLSDQEAKMLKVDPSTIVEWIYTEAELKETSGLSIGGVPNARIDGVRADLAAYLSEGNHDPRLDLRAALSEGGRFNTLKGTSMDPALLKLLGLSETATPAEVLSAIQLKLDAAAADKAELAIANTSLSTFQKDIDALKASERKRNEDKFVADALSSGRITAGDEEQWRALYALDATRASDVMGKRPANAATPVNQARQSDVVPTPAAQPTITGGTVRSREMRKQLAALTAVLASNPKAAAYARHAFGFEDRSNRLGDDHAQLAATAIANNVDLDAARIGFHAAFLEQLDTTDDMMGIGQVYTEVPSSKKVEQWDWMGDLPDFEEWKNERKLGSLEAFKLTLANKKWSNGIRVKNDDFKDDALGLLPPQVAQLAIRARMHRFTMMVKLLQNGFDGNTYPEVGDGLAYDDAFYFSDAHRGGNDNKLTVAFDSAGLAQAEKQLRKMRTYDGALPYGSRGTHLIVGPENEAAAEKLMTQEYLANAAGTATESNYQRGKYKIIVADQIDLVHPLDWFLVDLSGPIKPMLFQLREEITTSAITGGQGTMNDSLPRFSYDELWFGAEARYNAGYFEFRRCVGSRSA